MPALSHNQLSIMASVTKGYDQKKRHWFWIDPRGIVHLTVYNITYEIKPDEQKVALRNVRTGKVMFSERR